MRRGVMFGLGLAGTLAVHTGAPAQFAGDRPTAPPPQPAAAPQPAQTPPAPAFAPQPAPAVRPPAPQAQTHPLAVRPEHGDYMICVKSYTGPEARKLAEELTAYIREKHNAAAWLFEWGAEERQQEEQRRAAIRQAVAKRQEPFLKAQEELRHQAAAKGVEFIETPNKLRVPGVVIQEQWAVLVGGFKDEATARKALDVVHRWPTPDKPHLLDMAFTAQQVEAGEKVRAVNKEQAYINPFATAMLFNNPAVRRAPGAAPPVDPALAKLNAEEPYSLLKAHKSATLMVRDFTVHMAVKTKDEDRGVMDRLFGTEGEQQLDDAAKKARLLAERLRSPEMQKSLQEFGRQLGVTVPPIETFVLHIRNGSIVCVGQYDWPNDPEMAVMQRLLQGITFQVKYEDGTGRIESRKLFGTVTPMGIPKVR